MADPPSPPPSPTEPPLEAKPEALILQRRRCQKVRRTTLEGVSKRFTTTSQVRRRIVLLKNSIADEEGNAMSAQFRICAQMEELGFLRELENMRPGGGRKEGEEVDPEGEAWSFGLGLVVG